MNYALSLSPLSQDFRQQLHETVSYSLEYLTVAELRRQSLSQLWCHLRRLRAEHLLLVCEDSTSQTLLPVLQLLAGVTQARNIHIFTPELHSYPFKRRHALRAGWSLLVASMASLAGKIYTYWHAKWFLKKLSAEKLQRKAVNLQAKRKFLYINANLWFGVKAGGSVGHIAGVVNALDHAGFGVDYASIGGHQMINQSVFKFSLNSLSGFGYPAEYNYYRYNWQVFKQLRSFYDGKPPHIIYQRLSIANYSGALLADAFKIPLILEYNGSEVWIAKHWGTGLKSQQTALLCEQVCLQRADLIVTISAALRDELLSRGVAADKIVCYPNGIDPSIYDTARFSAQQCQAIRAQYHIANDATLLSFIGTFGRWHGVAVLAEAIVKLVQNEKAWLQQHRVHFMLIGDGLCMPEVKQSLARLDDPSYVTLTGLIVQHQAPAYLAASDILLSPHVANEDHSPFFGSPTKLFEYMAMGKAIIASDLAQLGEVLQPALYVRDLSVGATPPADALAVLCAPGCVDDIVAAIKFLVEHPQYCQQLGANARAEALAKYTWGTHVQQFIKQLGK